MRISDDAIKIHIRFRKRAQNGSQMDWNVKLTGGMIIAKASRKGFELVFCIELSMKEQYQQHQKRCIIFYNLMTNTKCRVKKMFTNRLNNPHNLNAKS